MGLLSLDSLKLRVKLLVGTESEKIAAKRHDNELFVFQSQNHKYKRNNVINLRILPLIENHHFLLCTLLLFNALANEALPIFLDAVLPAWAAGHILIIISLILYFFPHFGTFAFSLNIGNSGVIVRRDSAHSHLHRSRSACHRV